MKAKYYQRQDTAQTRYVVYVWWEGKKYTRGDEDDGSPLESERRAFRLCERINGAIESYEKYFDIRFWFRAKSEMRFDNYARTWLKRQEQRDKPYAPGTWDNVRRAINRAMVYFNTMDLREIRAGHLHDYKNHLQTGHREALKYLHTLFVEAWQREDIKHIPPFPKRTEPKPKIRWVIREWQDKIIEAMPQQDRPIFNFMKVTGVRKSEARALMWDCVDWDKKLVSIRRTFSGTGRQSENLKAPKSGWERDLPLTDELAKILKPLRGIGGFVFRNRVGTPYDRSNINRICNQARDKVGAPKYTLNQIMRTSKASQMAAKGENPWAIARLLGHTTIKTTQRYTAVEVEAIKEMVR